ncbi:O-antigen ligase family protein [Granulicella sp. dw_53]|uniref:O-antigen ligase family protein n=1 Tax=Granulicella sp. dw_53 TaxID=2719792 RepID=UPI001BD319D1|nr:O-antigen ligase family protein [Granulicella sp. dw_53]
MSATANFAEEEISQPLTHSTLAFLVGFFASSRISIVLFTTRILGTEPSTGAAISIVLNVLLLTFVWFDVFGSSRRTFRTILRLPSVRWVLAFILFSGCSLIWSETVSLQNSLAYWGDLVADVAIVFLLLRTREITVVSHSLMKGFITSTCCLAVVAWLMPTQADLRLGDEDFFNTNQIGNLCALSIFLAQYLMRRKEGRWGLATFFLIITLLRSLSKTTLVAFFVSEIYLVLRDRSMSRRTKVLLMIAAVLLILVFWGLFESYYDIYTVDSNQAETLTGRTAIWLFVLNSMVDHPWNLWIGHGFDSMWKVIPPFGPDRFEPRHAENELLQQFYAYGAVGIILFIGLYGSLYRQIRKMVRSPTKMLFLSLMLFIVVRGLAEAESFDLLLPLWFIVLMGTLADHENIAVQEMAILSPVAPHYPYNSPQRI